jgi:hypothetical protein
MATTERREAAVAQTPAGRTVIERAALVARRLGADQRPVGISDLHATYLATYPGIEKGKARDSFAASVNFHTVNVPSRFFYRDDRYKRAPWNVQPVFHRVARGQYMLLTEVQKEHFRKALADENPLVFEDEYGIDDLEPGA